MHKESKSELQFERIVFFSDAVFAIAITLLVIEIKVPHIETGSPDGTFLGSVIQLIPKFVGFFLSFFVVGAYWVGHHRIFGFIDRWNYGLIWRNVFFLMAIAFVPFSTAFFSEYPTRFIPLAVYAISFSLAGILEIFMWRYAVRSGLLRHDADPNDVAHLTWRMSVLPAVGIAAMLIGLINPIFSGFAFLLISVAHWLIRKKFAKEMRPVGAEVDNDGLAAEN
jgi:uncharacterized membrane protein